MFVNFPSKRVALTILFILLSYFNGAQLCFADPKNQSLAVKENLLGVKEGSVEEHLLEAQHRNKQLSMANKDLTIQNALLRKERDFYLKEVTVYKEIVQKLEVQKIETVENRAYANESRGTQAVGGSESVASATSYASVSYAPVSKSQNIGQIEEEEETINYTGTKDTVKGIDNRDNYIKNLENQLQLANTMLQNLKNETSLEENERLRESMGSESEGNAKRVTEISALQEEVERLRQGINPVEHAARVREIEERDARIITLQAEVERLSNGADPAENAQKDAEIATQNTRISALQEDNERLRQGINPVEHVTRVREIEERDARIITLQAEVERLSNGADPAENAQKDAEIATQNTRISALQEENERLRQGVDPVEHVTRVREIEERDARITALQAEVERLSNGEALAEHGRQVQRLETEIARLLGVAVESQSDRTNVWLPLDSDTFIHTEDLKPVLIVSDQALKDSITHLKDEYDRIQPSVPMRSRIFLRSLNQLDPTDVTSFVPVYNNLASINGVGDPVADECKRLLQETVALYESFQNEKSHEISGLKEYIDVQNIYSRISGEISFSAFISLMEAFDQAKDQFIEELKQRIVSLASTQAASCSKLLDWIELEYRDFTRSEFVKRFTSVPARDDPRYNDSGFVLLNQHLGMGSTFDNLGLMTRTNLRTGAIIPGLDAQDPFASFLIEIGRNPGTYAGINSNLVETVEKMYMMKHMNERWNNLKSGLDEDLRIRINRFNVRKADFKLLLDSKVKTILVSMIQEKEDFLKKGALVHASNRRELDTLLKPALSYENLHIWRVNNAVDLREKLIDIYTTYGGLVRTGFTLHTKNTKIKEFHEE